MLIISPPRMDGQKVARRHPGEARRIGHAGGPSCFISSMGICKFNDDDKIMYLDRYFPGVTPEQIKANTGFDIDVSRATEADPILVDEIRILREEIDPLNVYKMR